ncbi:SDR family NAD(P)-dependent oxidoreductase [Limobrevibacterium gyesilva]|uniref:SDR family NAD(P)-dependent oxidoreductase n=1 Tax=Limobrevibacterium gyesilva TaxID=2991712 RepID=A0AA41YIS3_9PROT|nr:SDR family NAD(P)-dependent oxidoreductase [Limobrevibacterium gyesilva]MCW3474366.1 SDR family NAD(P)-dependent oxidoreductase [Limobrevibacterium gyesilva]
MTAKLPPPQRKNPLLPTRQPLLPPSSRSRTALGLTAAAAEGRFALQVCADCGAVQYPPREACHACLGANLPWREVPAGGALIAETTVRITADPYFRQRTPWRTGIVALDCGPSVVAHLHGDVVPDGRVRMTLRLDKSGQGVMLALPGQDTPDMQDDRQMREMTCDPKGRRVLVTDGRNAFGQAMARAFIDVGAAGVFVGVADAWKPFPGQDKLAGEVVPLDITDTDSVHRLAASLGGRVEILVNTALHVRPGGILDRRDTVTAREEMEATYFGPMRLAQAFGPVLRSRGADGTHPACAWVNILSAYALAPTPTFGAFAATQAAALSLAHSLRAELRPLRVVNALVGPLDDEWHQAVPPPKVAPAALAASVLRALRDGIEDLAVGDIAQDLLARWKDNPTTLARELAAG